MRKTFDKKTKEKRLKIAKQHEEGIHKGCFFGCMMQRENDVLSTASQNMKLPEWIIHTSNKIFEGLPKEEAVLRPVQLLDAIPTDKDTEKARKRVMKRILLDKERGNIAFANGREDLIDAIKQCASLYDMDIVDKDTAESTAEYAAESARYAAESAEYAEYAAWSARSFDWYARSFDWYARSFDWCAAESAARYARYARYAQYAALSAVESARSFDWYARYAQYAALSAEYARSFDWYARYAQYAALSVESARSFDWYARYAQYAALSAEYARSFDWYARYAQYAALSAEYAARAAARSEWYQRIRGVLIEELQREE